MQVPIGPPRIFINENDYQLRFHPNIDFYIPISSLELVILCISSFLSKLFDKTHQTNGHCFKMILSLKMYLSQNLFSLLCMRKLHPNCKLNSKKRITCVEYLETDLP